MMDGLLEARFETCLVAIVDVSVRLVDNGFDESYLASTVRKPRTQGSPGL